jgi:gamma-glutamyl:cysteine ligase YbdK (ATP-grasp superfamily)
MTYRFPLGLFEAVGIEIEYMIVDGDTLSVRPIADELIKAQAGDYESEIELGEIAWSNELALHVVELKTNGPAHELDRLPRLFQDNVERINALLAPMNAMLMPGGMHPWMDPQREMRLWPHEYSPVYQTFDRIFGCKGHGWANLQAVHINLPFGDDDEFGRLHAAVRVLLPILPALAASSPIKDGTPSGWMDTRLEVYRTNAAKVPSVSGVVIPEPVFTRASYESVVLQRIYDDLAPHDPEGILRHEWVNARGCIARFDRGAVEIRVLDVQECPAADLAVAAAVIAAARMLAGNALALQDEQRRWPEQRLAEILTATVRDADRAVITDKEYLDLFRFPGQAGCTVNDLWRHLIETAVTQQAELAAWRPMLTDLLDQGCLARRIMKRLGADLRSEALRAVYGDLCRCVARGELFRV